LTYLYIATRIDGTRIKIGISIHPRARLASLIEARLEDAIILEAMGDAKEIEEALHMEFESFRNPLPFGNGRYEWFSSEIRSLVIRYLEEHKSELAWHRMYILNERTPKRRERPDMYDHARERNALLFDDLSSAVHSRKFKEKIIYRRDTTLVLWVHIRGTNYTTALQKIRSESPYLELFWEGDKPCSFILSMSLSRLNSRFIRAEITFDLKGITKKDWNTQPRRSWPRRPTEIIRILENLPHVNL